MAALGPFMTSNQWVKRCQFFYVIRYGNCHKKVMHDFHQNTFSDIYTFLKGTNEFLPISWMLLHRFSWTLVQGAIQSAVGQLWISWKSVPRNLYLTYRRTWVSFRNSHFYCPVWVKFCVNWVERSAVEHLFV